jgi:hypothetical protein
MKAVTEPDLAHLEVLFSGQTTFVLVAHARSGGVVSLR